MEILSDFEIIFGCCELIEGVMKYEGEFVEFQDRFLFIIVLYLVLEDGCFKFYRYGRSDIGIFFNLKDFKFKMLVILEIKMFLRLTKKIEDKGKFFW